MTFIEIFEPGMAHWRRQKELEKVLVQRTDQGAPGRQPDDLSSGRITIDLAGAQAAEADAEAEADAATEAEAGADATPGEGGAAPG